MEKAAAHKPFIKLAEDTRTFITQPFSMGALNQRLRQQLSAPRYDNNLQATQPLSANIAKIAVDAVTEILKPGHPNRGHLKEKLTRLFERQTDIYYQANIPAELRKRQYIAQHGLVISPDSCITSILDVLRVRAFMRGVDKALQHLNTRFEKNKPLHIVYPACGPYAPLLLPLLTYYREQNLYTPSDLQVTLIDMQKGAVMSLRAMVDAFGIADYIADIHCQDAMTYHKQKPVHLVLLEAMQHGFSREGHLPLAYYFSILLEPKGFLIPQEVSIRAMLNIGQREFTDQWHTTQACEYAHMDPQIVAERTDLGEILSVTPQSLRNLQIQILDEYTSLIECAEVKIPQTLDQSDQQLLLLCSQVRAFGNEWIDEYDSGITHPLPDEQICIDFTPASVRPGDLLIKRGDSLKFYYRLNGLPGFFAIRARNG